MQLNKNTLTIFYKLLHDSLFMALIFFILALIGEAILPGIIVSHIGFSKIVFFVMVNILLIKLIAKKITPDQIDQTLPPETPNLKKIIPPLITLDALLFLNNQLGMNIFLNLFFLLICGAIVYFSYKILFD